MFCALASLAALTLAPAQDRPTPSENPQSGIPTLESVSGHAPGARFTRLRDVQTWFERVARAAGGRLKLHALGTTDGGNPLYLAFLSSKHNLDKLNAIGSDLRHVVSGDLDPTTRPDLPVIAWLSFGVHGNEPSPTESAIVLVRELLSQPRHAGLLDKLVVVIDPCLNPDGRERYVAGLDDRVGKHPDPDPASFEHSEPWPGGRTNHYLQDLNRDWAFQTQVETKARIATWLQFPAQVHVDFHEMEVESEYFFFPAEVPINRHIAPQVLAWHKVFGQANADAFDARRWRYYSGEDFDLYYPGYGDSWPSLMGAIGMTYEVGGHTAGALAYRRRDGSIWTLRDRIQRHFVAALTTLETTAKHSREILADFWRSHREAEAQGRARANRYLCLPPGSPALDDLADLLVHQGIRVWTTTNDGRLVQHEGTTALGNETRPLPRGSLVIDMAQPRGRLASALLEPDPEISHLYFYDVSAWSLPLAFGLEAIWAERVVADLAPGPPAQPKVTSVKLASGTVGVVLDAKARDLAAISQAALSGGFTTRIGAAPFRIAGREFPIGSLVVLGSDAQLPKLEKLLAAYPRTKWTATATTRSQRGPDLGSQSFADLVPARALMAFGEGASLSTAGALWHLFENRLGLPLSRVPADSIGPRELKRYNVLILPGGGLPSGLASANSRAFLDAWLAEGGVLIAFASSARSVFHTLLGGKSETPKSGKKPKQTWKPSQALTEQARRRASPGSIVEVRVDAEHPLAAGYGETLPVLVRGSNPGFPADGPGQIVAYYGDAKRLSGYLSREAADRLRGSGYLLAHSRGRGAVVLFDQDPQFRLIWHGLTRLLINAAVFRPRRRIPR